MNVKIDRKGASPLYRQIIGQIAGWVKDGKLPPGATMPSVRQLARDLGVGIKTVRQAYDELIAQGVLSTRAGSGTFVSDRPAGVVLAAEREEMQGALSGLPPMVWEPYKFDSDFFGLPPHRSTGKQIIDFSRAQPDPALFPFDRIKQVATNMLWYPKEFFFDRGHAQGYQPLVEWIEHEMTLAGVDMSPGVNGVILTGGFQRALSLLLDLLAARGDLVAIESPTYASILNLLIAKGIHYEGVPVDGAGMDTEYLAQLLKKERIKAIITVPTYHNPTGTTLSAERREHLVRLAAQHRVPVIEDDWGRPLRYEGQAVAPLKALDPGGYVIHVGSFSKTFLPGLRIGWMTVPGEIAVTLVRAKLAADMGDSWFLQTLLHEFILKGFYDKHLRKTVKVYKARRESMLVALKQHMPPEVSWITAAGGLSVWVRLPQPIMSMPLLILAREAGVQFAPASLFMPGKRDAPALRLSFSRSTEEEIKSGIKVLASLIRDGLNQPEKLEQLSASFADLF
ncbi:PLP-dependent aminotransferase family protein [bacterium]|nr:PLP-dependent aminotransferase family protein [bacterium]